MLEVGARNNACLQCIARWAKRVGTAATAAEEAGSPMPWGFSLARALVYNNVRYALGFDQCRFLVSAAAPLAPETIAYFASLNMPLHEVYGEWWSSCQCPHPLMFPPPQPPPPRRVHCLCAGNRSCLLPLLLLLLMVLLLLLLAQACRSRRALPAPACRAPASPGRAAARCRAWRWRLCACQGRCTWTGGTRRPPPPRRRAAARAAAQQQRQRRGAPPRRHLVAAAAGLASRPSRVSARRTSTGRSACAAGT